MPGIDVQLPPLIDRDLYRGGLLDIVERALHSAIPQIEAVMKGGLSAVPIDTGALRASFEATVGMANTAYEQILTMWWNEHYASYLIEHAGIWRAHAAGTTLDWRPWAIQQALSICQQELQRQLIAAGLTAEFREATR